MTEAPAPPHIVALRGKIKKLVATSVPLSRYVVAIEWPSEELAEELTRYVDGYNEEPDLVGLLPEWNGSSGSSEWKTSKLPSFQGMPRLE
jgi:hypothetical protein